MRPDAGAVDTPQVEREAPLAREGALQPPEQTIPRPVAAPAAEAAIERLPGAVARRDIAPRDARVQPVEEAVDDRPMVMQGAPGGAQGRQERQQPAPLLIREFMATGHAPPRAKTGLMSLTAELHPISNTP